MVKVVTTMTQSILLATSWQKFQVLTTDEARLNDAQTYLLKLIHP